MYGSYPNQCLLHYDTDSNREVHPRDSESKQQTQPKGKTTRPRSTADYALEQNLGDKIPGCNFLSRHCSLRVWQRQVTQTQLAGAQQHMTINGENPLLNTRLNAAHCRTTR
uniref:Uncharacterized protein n=1 Tax=Physcomitrium patens TaxID=3218 RepID=A0A2K1JVT2_PHYPA|nr:hypothetical protein PHYPA_015404 [Physcomitrium patens]